MTKQEEIRVLTRQAFRDLLKSVHLNPMERESDLIEVEIAGYLRRLNLKGVVIKVDRELPGNVYSMGYINAQQDMLKARYVAVEPLVE